MTSTPKGKNLFLFKAVLSVNTIAYYAGSAYSWTSPVLPKLKSNDTTVNPLSRPITLLEDTWLSSGLIVGCLIGTFMGVILSHRFGRKKTLTMFSILIFTTHASFIFFHNIIWFLIGRVIMGMGVASTLSLLPSYIGEIAEDHNRGQAGSIFGVIFTMGHIINYCVGPFVSFEVLNSIHLIPMLIFYTTFVPFIPESPYFYISKNDEEGAKICLRKFRGHSLIEKELEQIKRSIEESRKNQFSFKDLIKSDVVIKGLIIASGILLCQPLTGFTTVLAYLQPIFEANKEFISPEFSVLVVGICPFITNSASTLFVEKITRKALLLISAVSATVCLTSLGVYFYFQTNGFDVRALSWLPILLVIIYIVTNNIGFASMPWIMAGEMFSPDSKSLGTGIATFSSLSSVLVMMAIFPYMSQTLGMSGSFLVYAGLSVLVVIYIVLVVPETKGKSFSEIQDLLKRKSKSNGSP